MRLSWPTISPPYRSFHAQTRSMNASRPRSSPFDPLLAELTFHHDLGGDARVVHPRHPERLEPSHPRPTDQDVLQGPSERMADVQATRDVRGRDHDAVGSDGSSGDVRMEVAPLDPRLRPPGSTAVASYRVGISCRGRSCVRVYRPVLAPARKPSTRVSILRRTGDTTARGTMARRAARQAPTVAIFRGLDDKEIHRIAEVGKESASMPARWSPSKTAARRVPLIMDGQVSVDVDGHERAGSVRQVLRGVSLRTSARRP